MISSIACIPRGAARAQPVVQDAENLEDDNERGMEDAEHETEDDEEDEDDQDDVAAAVEHAREVAASMNSGAAAQPLSVEEELRRLNMENYDDEETDVVGRILQGSRTEYRGHDQYLTAAANASEDDEAEEVKVSDLLVVAAKAEEDAASLEVWLFEELDAEGERHAYVHHDIPLPAFPLAVAWMQFKPGSGENGSFAAVGTMDPEIEIWNLDTLGMCEPAMVLGGVVGDGASALPSQSTKKKKKAKLKQGSHKDSVLSLSWNEKARNVLASGSADTTVKLWDVAEGTCASTLSHHSDKVQALAWNPTEASVLLSGAFGGEARVADTRTSDAVAAWSVGADVESVAWGNHNAATKFAVARDDGHVVCFDTRMGDAAAPLFTLAAHDEAATNVAFSPCAADVMYTCSVDKTVKVWSTSDDKPNLLKSQDVGAGAVLCLHVPADVPQVVIVGGAKGEVVVWDHVQCQELSSVAAQLSNS